MIYIQRKDTDGNLETVDEFDTERDAIAIVKEYRMCDPGAWYYISTRPCNAWRASLLVEGK